MKDEERGNWKHGMEFLMSCVGVAVGLGNIWRFPYICFKNGGGAFLIPYLICLVLVGFPQTLVQFAYPQYSNLGPGKAWECCPLFKGIGYGMLGITAVVSIYYNVIIAWALYYLANSFRSNLPWSTCGNSWNTPLCDARTLNIDNFNMNITENITLINSFNGDFNGTAKLTTPTEEFWEYYVLDRSSGIDNAGSMKWPLMLCNLAVWVITFLCVARGIKMSGKIMYVAASLPYIFLTILLVRGLTLQGSLDGLKYYFVPRWSELARLTVWTDAATQALYSMGFGAGDLVVLASYNNFHHNLYRDAVIIPIVDALTSLFAGCVIFVTLGYMSNRLGVGIDKVVSEGPGIAFMVYPEALSTLPVPQLWSVFFFTTLFTVGLDSQMVHVQNLSTAFGDISPRRFRNRVAMTTGGICLAGFVLSMPCTTQGGVYVIQLMDWYLASLSFLLITFLEITVIAWIYGARRLKGDIEMMLGRSINFIWTLFWKFVCPFGILLVLVASIVNHKPVKYGDTVYPNWSVGVGWLIGLIPVIFLPINIITTLVKAEGSLKQRLKFSIKPSSKWKPAFKDVINGETIELEKLDKTFNNIN